MILKRKQVFVLYHLDAAKVKFTDIFMTADNLIYNTYLKTSFT